MRDELGHEFVPEDDEEPEPDPKLSAAGADVPEADALEQRQSTDPDDMAEDPERVPSDASEADALDQARVVPFDEEPW